MFKAFLIALAVFFALYGLSALFGIREGWMGFVMGGAAVVVSVAAVVIEVRQEPLHAGGGYSQPPYPSALPFAVPFANV